MFLASVFLLLFFGFLPIDWHQCSANETSQPFAILYAKVSLSRSKNAEKMGLIVYNKLKTSWAFVLIYFKWISRDSGQINRELLYFILIHSVQWWPFLFLIFRMKYNRLDWIKVKINHPKDIMEQRWYLRKPHFCIEQLKRDFSYI